MYDLLLTNVGASVAEWLRSLTSNHLPLTAASSSPTEGKNLSCEEAIQLASLVPFRTVKVRQAQHNNGGALC